MIAFAIIVTDGSGCNHFFDAVLLRGILGALLVSGDRATTYGYAEVEAALARVFLENSKNIAPMRGRLKAFQRAGLTPESPGRGRVIRYTIANIYDWALALALADFGLPPESIIPFIKQGYFYDNYLPMIAKKKNDFLFFCVRPFILSNPDKQLPYHVALGSQIAAEIKGNERRPRETYALHDRIALINLTKLASDLDKALRELKDERG
jgi:hypothetical protein